MSDSYEIENSCEIKNYQENDLVKELIFARRVNSIRNKLYECVKSRLRIDCPKELLNRWLMFLISNNFNFKQLLDTLDDLDNNVIGRELVLAVPYRLQSDYS